MNMMKRQPFVHGTLTRMKSKYWSKVSLGHRSVSSPTLPRLPNELIELILDHLYLDTSTLLRCALVGRSWAHPSQRGIFREIVLEVPNNLPQRRYTELTQSFLRIDALLANPRLASYVHSLKLFRISRTWIPTTIIGRAFFDHLNVVVVNIVRRLSNVNKLSLELVVWEGLSPPLKEALTGMLGSPSLKELSFTMFSIPTFAAMASLLSHATHLKVLQTDNWESWDPVGIVSEMKGIGAPRSIQLDRLQFTSPYWGGNSNLDRYLAWFQQEGCLFDIRNLQSLQIGISSFALVKLLQLTGNNLRELDVRDIFSEITQNPADAMPLTYTTNLRKLTLHFIETDLHSALPWIQGILKPLLTYGSVIPLQHMAIYFSGLSILDDSVDLWNHLAGLDRLLSNAEFAQLETLSIVIGVIFFSPHGVQELFRKALSHMEGSGKLTVILLEGDKKEKRKYTSIWPRFIWKYTNGPRIYT